MDVEAFPKKEGGYTMYSVPSILTAALSTTCLSVRVHQLYQIAIVLMLFQHGRDGAADWRMPMEDPDDVSPNWEAIDVLCIPTDDEPPEIYEVRASHPTLAVL